MITATQKKIKKKKKRCGLLFNKYQEATWIHLTPYPKINPNLIAYSKMNHSLSQSKQVINCSRMIKKEINLKDTARQGNLIKECN